MTSLRGIRIRAHQQNLERYCRLLAGTLTDVERDYLHKRIVEERQELERLQPQGEADCNAALAIIAAESLAKSKRGQV